MHVTLETVHHNTRGEKKPQRCAAGIRFMSLLGRVSCVAVFILLINMLLEEDSHVSFSSNACINSFASSSNRSSSPSPKIHVTCDQQHTIHASTALNFKRCPTPYHVPSSTHFLLPSTTFDTPSTEDTQNLQQNALIVSATSSSSSSPSSSFSSTFHGLSPFAFCGFVRLAAAASGYAKKRVSVKVSVKANSRGELVSVSGPFGAKILGEKSAPIPVPTEDAMANGPLPPELMAEFERSQHRRAREKEFIRELGLMAEGKTSGGSENTNARAESTRQQFRPRPDLNLPHMMCPLSDLAEHLVLIDRADPFRSSFTRAAAGAPAPAAAVVKRGTKSRTIRLQQGAGGNGRGSDASVGDTAAKLPLPPPPAITAASRVGGEGTNEADTDSAAGAASSSSRRAMLSAQSATPRGRTGASSSKGEVRQLLELDSIPSPYTSTEAVDGRHPSLWSIGNTTMTYSLTETEGEGAGCGFEPIANYADVFRTYFQSAAKMDGKRPSRSTAASLKGRVVLFIGDSYVRSQMLSMVASVCNPYLFANCSSSRATEPSLSSSGGKGKDGGDEIDTAAAPSAMLDDPAVQCFFRGESGEKDGDDRRATHRKRSINDDEEKLKKIDANAKIANWCGKSDSIRVREVVIEGVTHLKSGFTEAQTRYGWHKSLPLPMTEITFGDSKTTFVNVQANCLRKSNIGAILMNLAKAKQRWPASWGGSIDLIIANGGLECEKRRLVPFYRSLIEGIKFMRMVASGSDGRPTELIYLQQPHTTRALPPHEKNVDGDYLLKHDHVLQYVVRAARGHLFPTRFFTGGHSGWAGADEGVEADKAGGGESYEAKNSKMSQSDTNPTTSAASRKITRAFAAPDRFRLCPYLDDARPSPMCAVGLATALLEGIRYVFSRQSFGTVGVVETLAADTTADVEAALPVAKRGAANTNGNNDGEGGSGSKNAGGSGNGGDAAHNDGEGRRGRGGRPVVSPNKDDKGGTSGQDAAVGSITFESHLKIGVSSSSFSSPSSSASSTSSTVALVGFGVGIGYLLFKFGSMARRSQKAPVNGGR